MKRFNRHRRYLKKRGSLGVRKQGCKKTLSLVLEKYKNKPQTVEEHESVMISQSQGQILRLSLLPVI